MRDRRLRVVRQVLVLLLVGMTTGLWAQDSDDVVPPDAPQTTITRPQRTQRPDPTSSSLSTTHYPLTTSSPTTNYQLSTTHSLLTPENLNHPLTQHYINRYSSAGGITWINSVIKNGNIYLPYVIDEIERLGLPPELAFLPFIESGYLGTARSKSGATGPWQFMMNSIAPFNMKVNDLIDERRDFRKSTGAALQKLADNYRALGDWPLALAAYNAGLGGVSRTVNRTKIADYWVLCDKGELRHETVHYVPKFLAVSYILTRPRQFGLDYWPETVEWTTLKPGKQVSLDIIAQETGVDRKLLQRLNPELLHGITPADAHYELKILPAQVETITGLLEREDTRLLRYYRYQIQYGDTLSALSRHYSVPVDMIEQHNPGIQSRYLKIGDILVIPAFKDTVPYRSGANTAVREGAGAFEGTHLVAQGDTLWSLAIRYQVDPQVLAEENNMDFNQILSIGKVLKVPIIE